MNTFNTIFVFLLLYLQILEIYTDNNITQGMISTTQFGFNNTQKIQNIVTVPDSNDEDRFDDVELRRLFVRNFIIFRRRHQDKLNTKTGALKSRQSRNVETRKPKVIKCYECFANSSIDIFKSDENCYKGVSIPTTECANVDYCYTELHPLFIRRGCAIPGTGNINRTFVCKCHLCNDKPSYEMIHYNYKKIDDWEFDNHQLQRDNTPLMCKICKTNGTNENADFNCRQGKHTPYVACATNQLCYTRFDEDDYVARGCIDKPIYNSFYNICNTSACNNEMYHYHHLRLAFLAHKLVLSPELPFLVDVSSAQYSSKLYTIHDVFFLLYIVFTIMCM